jgi:hypothetical protein
VLLQRCEWLRQAAVDRNAAERVTFAKPQSTVGGLAKLRCIREHGPEHGLELTWRTADHTEHFRGRRLGSILRFVFWHSIALACLVGLLVMLQAYVPPFTRMVY